MHSQSQAGKYRPAVSIPVAYQAATGAASAGAALQRSLRIQDRFWSFVDLLVLAGKDQPLARLAAQLEAKRCKLPILPITEAVLAAGRSNRNQDEARDLALADTLTDAELDLLEARTLRDMAEDHQLFRAIRAEKETRKRQAVTL